MIDERTAELIHADIDDCLPEARRAELSRILLADPEARALHRDLQRLQDQLAAIGAKEVPTGLADSIMAAVPAAERSAREHAAAPSWRYAIALAASVALAAVVLRIGGLNEGIDGTAAVGTMVGGQPASIPVAIDRPELSGSVQLRATGKSLFVDLDVALHDDVQIVATQGNSSASLAGRADAPDRKRLSLELPGGHSGPVTLQFASPGQPLGEIVIEAPVDHR
jgi:hypothetical protein